MYMLTLSTIKQSQHNRQSGVALLEATIIMPVLVFLFMSLIEIGTLCAHYAVLTQIVREGMRIASSTPEVISDPSELQYQCDYLDKVCYFTATTKSNGTSATTLDIVTSRIIQLVNIEAFSFKDSMFITAKRKNKDVFVSIDAVYDGFFITFDGLKLHVEATGPYLY